MAETLLASLSSKGQIVIAKPIRDKLGLVQNQQFIERIEGKTIVLEPLPKLTDLGGVLKGKSKKTVEEMMREAGEGWD